MQGAGQLAAHAAVQARGVHRPVFQAELGGVGAEEDAEHRGRAVDAAAHAARLQRLVHAGAQAVALAVQLALDLAGLEDLELGDGGGGHQRGAAVGPLVGHALRAVALGVARERDHVHDVGAAGERGAGQAARHRLREAREVGRHAEIFLRAAGGHAEAGDDLVEDQHHAAPARLVAQLLQELGIRGHRHRPAAGRLEDDRRHLVVFQQLAHVVDVVARRDERRRERAGRHAGGGRNLERILHRGHERVVHAVEVALELDDVIAPGEGARHAHGQRRRLGARQREAHALGARHDLAHQLGPAHLELGAGTVVQPLLRLLGDGLHHRRVLVAQHQRAVSAPAVEVLVAVHVPLAGALGAVHVEGERREVAAVVRGAARHGGAGALVQGLGLRAGLGVLLLDGRA